MDDERLRAVFEHSGAALAITDDDGIVVDASPALCELFARRRDELVGRRLTGLVVEDRGLLRLTDRDLAERALERFEEQRRAIVALTRMSVDEEFVDDLLERSVHLLVDHLDAARAAVAQRLPDGAGLFYRASAGLRLDGDGRASLPIPTMHQAEYTSSVSVDVVSEDLLVEDRFQPDPRLVSAGIRSTASAVIDVDGRPWGVLSVHRTEPASFTPDDRLYLEAAARVLSRALAAQGHRNTEEAALEQRRLADAGQLAAGLAHDLGNALAVLKLHAQLVLLHPDLPATVRDQVGEIEHHTDLAHALVAEIVGSTRDDPPDLLSEDLRELLARLVPVLRRMLPRGITLDYEPASQECAAPVDRGRLHQIIFNLVTNAADAMVDGGVVSLRCQPATDPAPGMRLTVSDDGPGMEPDVRARAFEPFFSTKPQGKGTGLGLPQVGRLVDEHGGTIELVSEVGEGTRAEIWLPRR